MNFKIKEQNNNIEKIMSNNLIQNEELNKKIETISKDANDLKESLNAISSNISGVKLDPKLTPEETIEAAFSNIEKFSQQNQKQMQDVGKLMQMQVDIDKIIEGKGKGVQPSQEQINKIKARKITNKVNIKPNS